MNDVLPEDWALFNSDASTLGVTLDDAQIEKFKTLLKLMRMFNKRASLTSDLGLKQAIKVHFLDSLSIVPFIKSCGFLNAKLLDVGTGGGFPGIPLKIAIPSLDLHLIEAKNKKVEYLQMALKELEIEGATYFARAEEAAHKEQFREKFDFVTSRALGSWPTVLELSLPFCRVGGFLLGQRGADAEVDAIKYLQTASILGGTVYDVSKVGAGIGLNSRSLIMVRKINSIPDKFPRKAGIPAKRPLG